jgi:DNA-directed RNA polymerase specialized sigma24 family protein
MTEQADFTALVGRVLAKDESAAAELVRRFEPELTRMIRFHLTDPGVRRLLDSLDVCQSVLAAFFARLFGGEVRVTNPRQAMGLLGLMARHKVIDHGRRHRSLRKGAGAVKDVADGFEDLAVDSASNPADALENLEIVDAVRTRLGEQERRILDLWMQNYEWPEIAARLDGDAEALRKRLSRGIDAAADSLGLLETTT